MDEEEPNQVVEHLMSDQVEFKQTSGSKTQGAEKFRIYKNVFVFSFSYLFQFSAINGLNNLQSSLNSHENLGIYGLLTSSLAFLFSCLFVPLFLVRILGFKWSLVLSQHIALFYIIANYFPSFYTIIPISIVYGAALSVLWTLMGSFIVHMSNEYGVVCAHKQLHHENIMFKFFGIFMIVFQLSSFCCFFMKNFY